MWLGVKICHIKACCQISSYHDNICNDSLSFLALAQTHYNCVQIKLTLAMTNSHFMVSKSLRVFLHLTQQNIEIYIENNSNKHHYVEEIVAI